MHLREHLMQRGTLRQRIGVNLEVLIFCHHIHVLYIPGYVLISLSFSLSMQRYWMGVFTSTRTNSCAMRTPSIGVTLSRTPRLNCWWCRPTTATSDVSIARGWKPVQPVTLDENQKYFFWYLLWTVKANHMPTKCRIVRTNTHSSHQQKSCPIPFYSSCLPGGHLEAKSHSVRSTCEPFHCSGMVATLQRGPWSCCLLCSF